MKIKVQATVLEVWLRHENPKALLFSAVKGSTGSSSQRTYVVYYYRVYIGEPAVALTLSRQLGRGVAWGTRRLPELGNPPNDRGVPLPGRTSRTLAQPLYAYPYISSSVSLSPTIKATYAQ